MVVVFMIQVNDYIGYFFKKISHMENLMKSFQRVQSIVNLQSQAQLITNYDKEKGISMDQSVFQNNNHKKKDLHTPAFKNCKINIQNMSMKYAPHLPLILNKLNMSTQYNQKIGIVGRTGAGKSTIVQVLLRLTEPQSESIYKINDLDAIKLGLHTLRNNISVIPQKTFFFKGTLRNNLDPFDQYTDQIIWQSLENSNLKSFVQNLQNGLEANITMIENTFSVGQRQLLSLSRVLLRKTEILILDQATSSVDSHTDQLIQRKIKQNFSNATVFTIAHRLSTIADYGKIAVLQKGKLIEFDNPHNLLAKKGIFWQMVQKSIDKDKIKQIIQKSYRQKYYK